MGWKIECIYGESRSAAGCVCHCKMVIGYCKECDMPCVCLELLWSIMSYI
jgi:hypothetical protein